MTCRKTKIVCTIGPASSSPEVMEQLVAAGMDVARMNFSHGSHADHARNIATLREVAAAAGRRVAILQDLSGPKIRIGAFPDGAVTLVPGAEFVLTTRPGVGSVGAVSVNTPELIESVRPGDRILVADGELELKVVRADATDATCEVVVGGLLRSNKGLSTPGVKLRLTVPTPKDLADLEFGLSQGVDWVAQSFVRTTEEVRKLKSIIRDKGADVPVMVKLEKREAFESLNEIVREADGIMVARGDLALEIGLPEIPAAQKEIIRKAGIWGKPEVTATQMLESMIANPRPTRAEVTDIANAIYDGTDAIMLSGETAVGQYPIQAVRTMVEVATATEAKLPYLKAFRERPLNPKETVENAIARAACETAIEVGAKVIICCTRSGQTARLVSRFRPEAPVAAVSPNERALCRSLLCWGTCPFHVDVTADTDTMIRRAKEVVRQSELARPGDRVVIVAGLPLPEAKGTNMLKVDVL